MSRKYPDKWGKKKYEDFDLDIKEVEENSIDISEEDVGYHQRSIGLGFKSKKTIIIHLSLKLEGITLPLLHL